jgi:hypothetical protein
MPRGKGVEIVKKGILLAMAAAAFAAGTASAVNVDARTSLTIHKKSLTAGRVLVFGNLRSSVKACVRHKVIRLYRVLGRRSRLLRRTRTDARGRYNFRMRPRTTMVVYTRFAGSFYSSYAGQQVCKRSKSRRIQIP